METAHSLSTASDTKTAWSTYQVWLDAVAKAFWDRDFVTVAEAMALPSAMATSDAILWIEDLEQMITVARDFRDNLDQMGAQSYHRVCTKAWFVGPDGSQIDGEHVTYIMRGAQKLIEPFFNEMTLIYCDGRWRGAGIKSTVQNADCLLLSPEELRAQMER